MKKIIRFASALERDQFIVSAIKQKLNNTSGLRFAASGGSSADLFSSLSKNQILHKAHIFLVDERYVPLDDDASNYKLLCDRVTDFSSKIIPVKTSLNITEAARDYSRSLTKDQSGFLFDVCILGMGVDGHTASLFPYNTLNIETGDHYGWTEYSNASQVPLRLSLSVEAIKLSKIIFVLTSGSEKKEILKKLESQSIKPEELPIKHFIEGSQVFFTHVA